MKEQLQNQTYLEALTQKDVKQTAQLYAEVFAGPPWNEWTACSECLVFYGKDTNIGDRCKSCGTELLPAYPESDTISYVQKELEKPQARGVVMKENGIVSAFSWGYAFDSAHLLAQEKYRSEYMLEAIENVLNNSGIDNSFFYISECGVAPKMRGKGISNTLVRSLLDTAQQLDLPTVMRTNWQSPMIAVAKRFEMQQIMGPNTLYSSETKTVMLTSGFVNNLEDQELPDRVLFMKLPI